MLTLADENGRFEEFEGFKEFKGFKAFALMQEQILQTLTRPPVPGKEEGFAAGARGSGPG